MKSKRIPERIELHRLFEYRDGCLYRKIEKGGQIAGSKVGSMTAQGYLAVSINKSRHKVHRVIYAMFFDCDQNLEIDHINGNRLDNRIENLRAVTASINQQNQIKARSNNKTGFLGVCFHKKTKKYVAQIQVYGKSIHIGYFNTPEDAHSAYINAKRKIHEGCTI